MLDFQEAAPVQQSPPGAPHSVPLDPACVDRLIDAAGRHPLGLEFLIQGDLGSVAVTFGVHAFTVEAARARLSAAS